jgi:phosphatidylglycerophosphatase A
MNRQQTDIRQNLRLSRLFTSCLGLGFLPVAPGTWGSLPPAVIFALLSYFAVPPVIISVIMMVMLFDGVMFCLLFAPSVIKATDNKDPCEVVADELAGQAITFLVVPFFMGTISPILVALIGFLAFRMFDIFKPWPCRKLENLPAGLGIAADDLMAGIYAAFVLQLCVYLIGK